MLKVYLMPDVVCRMKPSPSSPAIIGVQLTVSIALVVQLQFSPWRLAGFRLAGGSPISDRAPSPGRLTV
ncbi:hypothetical protein B9Y64_06345 [Stenotrophomonas maltophilia]|uniref:Uncharacterized protein n=1 Tax=Stenotrophomonas maltophilia TaxID=40324 RepID=A0A2J0UCP1_STEMA|nr:hypothetical protein B9Y64_06345 [Stenotrophomonas maltophilia]